MTLPCLIVATEAGSFSVARMPKALAHAGFEVALLAPHDSLAEKSRHIARVGHLPPSANASQWIFAFAATMRAVRPRIVFAGDRMSLRLLHMLVTSPPPGLQPALFADFDALIRESLGDPAHFPCAIDAALLPVALAPLGIDVASPQSADGKRVSHSAAAWKGRWLAGWSGEHVIDAANGSLHATVVRRVLDPATRDATMHIIEAMAMSGLVQVEFRIDPASGRPQVVEIDRCLAPGLHSGSKIDVDLCAALSAAIEGRASPTRSEPAPDESRFAVHFPQEWLRDADSDWLRKHPVDVPWDEPELFEALIALKAAP